MVACLSVSFVTFDHETFALQMFSGPFACPFSSAPSTSYETERWQFTFEHLELNLWSNLLIQANLLA